MSKADGGSRAAMAKDVYIRSDQHVWIPAQVIQQDNDVAKVTFWEYITDEFIMNDSSKGAVRYQQIMVNLKDYQGRALPLQNIGNDGKLQDFDDILDLPHLHEAAILYNLKKRHCDGKPYTRLGDIVIAVNPYQRLEDLYTDKLRMKYAQTIVWDHNDRDPRIVLPPHPYEVSALCYKGLVLERKNQSIVVTGISGSGKTETVKICMDHIATMQQDPNDKSTEMSMVVKRNLESNRLLEAFGNAKTIHNDNSSRFGKYMKLQFHHVDAKKPGDRPRAALAGSTSEVVLLEKSRVVFHDTTERSYHAFYQLLSAPEDKKAEIWKGLKGTTNESFAYVGTAPHVLMDGKDDSAHFIETNAALELIGITGEQYLTLWRAIVACLQLGNLTFKSKPGNAERTVITSTKELNELAELIGCDSMVLEKAFTERTRNVRGEEYNFPLRFDVAKKDADAFAMEIYAKTFLWLVRAINDANCAENNYPGSTSINYGLIGLLDMFGFESLPVNGFEQFCINYCYEKVQQKFTFDIFGTVHEEYKAEGLNLDDLKFNDNSVVLDLIEGNVGIITQLNTECAREMGNDRQFCYRITLITGQSPVFFRTLKILQFGIRHYSGVVVYKAQDFVVRNTDTLPTELSEAARLCTNKIISQHLDNNSCTSRVVKDVVASGSREPPKSSKDNLTDDTVMTQCKNQLTKLVNDLNETQSRYVVCIKPNSQKQKLVMKHQSAMKQLRDSGVVAAALMSVSVYQSKLFHAGVVERYRKLYLGKPKGGCPDVKSECEDICKMMLKNFKTLNKSGANQSGFAIGNTRAYFRSECLEYLESERSKILELGDDTNIDSWLSCSLTNEKNNIYIRSGEYSWIPAHLVHQQEDIAKVVIPEYDSENSIMSDCGKGAIGFKMAIIELKHYQGRALPVQNGGSDGTLQEVDDIVNLPHIHEAAILYNLKKRHCDGKPYTRLGDIVIAVNPYQWLEDLYTDKLRMQYAQKIIWDHNDRDPRIGLPPHPYEVSALCYKGLALERKNQSIVVTGISGAGKTETVKICMDHIATIRQDPNDKSTEKSMVVRRILESNRLLEAFGNAKTIHNDNSSRFGKYTKLQFHHIDAKKPGDRPRLAMAGSTSEVVLLEKSRVVFHDDAERNYHAFYQLLSAPEDKKAEIWKGLSGTTNESFAYVGTAPHVLIDGKDDSAHFIETNAALELIGISGEKYLTLWRAIAACLQLGNLTFKPISGDADRLVIVSPKELRDLAELIECDSYALEMAFTERTIKIREDTWKVLLPVDMAKDLADTFAKEIYAKTFLWLVRFINNATCAEKNYLKGASINYGVIGLLDIFGFESFPVNGFEQICINYCNEKLQQKFIYDVFRTVEEEYKAEGLNLDDIRYDDNSDVLALYERKNYGFIDRLNKSCYEPKIAEERSGVRSRSTTDAGFFVNYFQNDNFRCGSLSLFSKRTIDRLQFGIHHHAGAVIYNAKDFLVRNIEPFSNELSEMAKLCRNAIISEQLDSNRDTQQVEYKEQGPQKKPHVFMADHLEIQMTNLMNDLSETQSHYVCCVTPNTQKRMLVMEHNSTMKQLRGSGLVAAAMMSRSTYPNKLLHAEVVERYGMLNDGNYKICYPDVKSECEDICKKMLKHFETTNNSGKIRSGFAIGKTRAYFRSGCVEHLESERSKILGQDDDSSIDPWIYCSSTDYV